MNPWVSFAFVIVVQFLVFVFLALIQKRTPKNIAVILAQSLLLGFIFGIPFDLIIGNFAGVYSYVNGFTVPFLIANGIFSFGLWQATIVLLQKKNLFFFCLFIAAICGIYETTNIFFPVWDWNLSDSTVVEIGIVFLGYIGLAVGGAVVARLIFKTPFRLLEWKIAQK